MAIIAKPKTFTANTVAVSADVNSNFDTLYNDYNGNITGDNLSANAAIPDTKLATISTGGKVNISALTATSQAAGDLMYASSATTYTRLAKGTSLQILRMNTGATAPEWGKLDPTMIDGEIPDANLPSSELVKGWINMNGTGTVAINDSNNVSGIVDNGTGDYTITWDTDFADAKYATAVGCWKHTDNSTVVIDIVAKAAGSVEVLTRTLDGNPVDNTEINVIAIQ